MLPTGDANSQPASRQRTASNTTTLDVNVRIEFTPRLVTANAGLRPNLITTCKQIYTNSNVWARGKRSENGMKAASRGLLVFVVIPAPQTAQERISCLGAG